MYKYKIDKRGNLQKSSFLGFLKEDITMPPWTGRTSNRIKFSLKYKAGMKIAERDKDYKSYDISVTYNYNGHTTHLCARGLKDMFGEIPEKIYYKFY